MILPLHRCHMLVALLAVMSFGVAAETRIEAPGGVAAQTIT
jgi:hypothetical protein